MRGSLWSPRWDPVLSAHSWSDLENRKLVCWRTTGQRANCRCWCPEGQCKMWVELGRGMTAWIPEWPCGAEVSAAPQHKLYTVHGSDHVWATTLDLFVDAAYSTLTHYLWYSQFWLRVAWFSSGFLSSHQIMSEVCLLRRSHIKQNKII